MWQSDWYRLRPVGCVSVERRGCRVYCRRHTATEAPSSPPHVRTPHAVQRSDDQYVRRVFGRHSSAVGPPVRTSPLCQFTSPRRRVVFVTTARAASDRKRRAEGTQRAAFVRTCGLETYHNRKKETRTTAEPLRQQSTRDGKPPPGLRVVTMSDDSNSCGGGGLTTRSLVSNDFCTQRHDRVTRSFIIYNTV